MNSMLETIYCITEPTREIRTHAMQNLEPTLASVAFEVWAQISQLPKIDLPQTQILWHFYNFLREAHPKTCTVRGGGMASKHLTAMWFGSA